MVLIFILFYLFIFFLFITFILITYFFWILIFGNFNLRVKEILWLVKRYSLKWI